ncbi:MULTISPECIES: DUF3253 domain-containing protein [unclassified Acidovorax]|uniref:DUF3253 domain-containing protein n=1 Tax=unclassified Acidovorax TaxID=2684926 RepID=UPI0028834B01|nr:MULTISPECIES: DUF3253 domain-containing protein [unclassified Acidovorax]
MAVAHSADAPNAAISEAMIEVRIFFLLATRQEGATICPSEVARSLAGADGPWRDLMPQIRDVAGGLVKEHRLSVTRRGEPVDSNEPGGPIRLGRAIP